jgi:urea carboxylase
MRTARWMGLRTVAVFSELDRSAPHVRMADVAVSIGPAPARDSYLRVDAVIDAALQAGAGAIHPGYGFLSENADFATAVESAGLAFVGPTPAQLEMFGAKHTARELARTAGVPMIDGSDLLPDVEAALDAGLRVGYPVMLKATGGGGGIGMEICATPDKLASAYHRVRRVAASGFASGEVFLERYVSSARHVEVQVFGDGAGRVHVLGDRDCTLQRRNQKVIEECPAPDLPARVRAQLATAAAGLCSSVNYRSAGTVEFVYDAAREEASFLEVNTRLQVEHPVTEEVYGIDLVECMLRLALGQRETVESLLVEAVDAVEARHTPPRHSVEARIYAEDPHHGHRPSAGLLTQVAFPANARVDAWIETGTRVGTSYDPLLAKVITSGETREAALRALHQALLATRIDGIETNLGQLRSAVTHPDMVGVRHTTSTLTEVADREPRIEVERAGTLTTVQDWPGRLGLWQVGVPPSGPMDDRSFRLGNVALGNPEGAAGLECTATGPALRFSADTCVCVTGAPVSVTVDGTEVPMWEPVSVAAGALLDIGPSDGPGLRVYLLVAGGLDVAAYLGSLSTFTLGGFGGHGGRALAVGDVVRAGAPLRDVAQAAVPTHARPNMASDWHVGVTVGPHAAPDFFTPEDIEAFYAAEWGVHYNSARTGVRLVGPAPRWARRDGGDAGLHPSNIHDTPYSIGAVDYTGDVPILLGPDGPSLGGFVCPATVVTGERWKLGQLRPGDVVRFVPVEPADAPKLRQVSAPVPLTARAISATVADDGVLGRVVAGEDRPAVTYRRSGDDNLLVEYGPMTLDLGLRMRVHALAESLTAQGLPGVVDVTPGIRSLQLHVDPDVLPVARLLDVVRETEVLLPPTSDLRVPSRVVHLPLSWDDPATREAIARYMAGVRDDAPWCPWNIEFIRRVNGLDHVQDVYRTVFDASYLVLGLGDVYLGAPVATPLDPRHRLITTKYNPARTWTPENAVGIGGAYLCIYGMEGPGGYQFVGRTVQVWSPFRQSGPFEQGSPALLRYFDRIQWYPVAADELLDMRADLAAGRLDLGTEDGEFSIAEHDRFLAENSASITEFRTRQQAAFGVERSAWVAAGEFDRRPEPDAPTAPQTVLVPDGGSVVAASFLASVWRVDVRPGDVVVAGTALVALEAMKLESVLSAPHDAVVTDVLVVPGSQVGPGTPLVVLAPVGEVSP